VRRRAGHERQREIWVWLRGIEEVRIEQPFTLLLRPNQIFVAAS
jgi:hypothetical protein